MAAPRARRALQDIKEAFGLFDVDETGEISTSDLMVTMRAMGFEPSPTELQKMVVQAQLAVAPHVADPQAKTVTEAQFTEIMTMKMGETSTYEETCQAFRMFGPTVETERNEACLKATEDLNAVMILNSSGFQGSATVCIVEAKETIFISTQGQPQDFMDRSEGRLVSLSNTNSESLEFAVARFLDSGVLTADSIVGVASPDTPGQPETVEESLVAPLEAAGVEVVYDVIGCNGSTICTDGVVDSVTNMRNAGITHSST